MALHCSCQRYVLLGCFVALGISGLVVFTAGSIFIYQFQQYGYQTVDIENLVVSPAVLIALGFFTCPLATYFWCFIDNKYNRLQFIMFTVLLIILFTLASFTAILALQKHKELVTMLTTSMEDSLKSSPRLPPPDSTFNHTEIKMKCCSSQETPEEDFTPGLCCDFERHENTTRISCEKVYGTECRHLTINRYQSILIHVFLLALFSVAFQILVILKLLYYARIKKKQRRNRAMSHF
ncbi:uncharacterized protein LOC107036606 [Diachasma alloeum]|uniref:uncharacterized protein LOC107036606 n=1 Tax=Diachasma alloeum TaxID=454923 RepID=UPI0007384EC7|nr:uncharacterized protein LOC107036606 [Diachasma alloeum]